MNISNNTKDGSNLPPSTGNADRRQGEFLTLESIFEALGISPADEDATSIASINPVLGIRDSLVLAHRRGLADEEEDVTSSFSSADLGMGAKDSLAIARDKLPANSGRNLKRRSGVQRGEWEEKKRVKTGK